MHTRPDSEVESSEGDNPLMAGSAPPKKSDSPPSAPFVRRWSRFVGLIVIVVCLALTTLLVTGALVQNRQTATTGVPSVLVASVSFPIAGVPTDPFVIPNTGDVLVSNWGSTTLTWIPNDSATVGRLIPVGGSSYQTVFDSANSLVYASVVNTTETGLVSVNVSIVSSKTLSLVDTMSIGTMWSWIPPLMTVDDRANLVFIESTLAHQNTILTAISGATNSVAWTTPIPYAHPGVVADQANGRVYVMSGGNNGTVTIVNATSGAIDKVVRVGSWPSSAAVDAVSGDIYVLNYQSDNVSILSGTTDTVVGTVEVPGLPNSIVIDRATGNAFVGSAQFNQTRNPQFFNGTETMISGSSRTSVSSHLFGNDFQGPVADTPTGILCMSPGNLTLINGTTGSAAETIPIPPTSGYAVYDRLNGHIYVTSYYPGVMTVLQDLPSPPATGPSGVSWALPGTYGYFVGAGTGASAVGSWAWFYGRRPRPPKVTSKDP